MVNNNIFYNAINEDITMVKGDTLSFNFQIDGMGADRLDDVVFTVKDNPDSNTVLFKCDLSEGVTCEVDEENHLIYTLRVSPNKTKDLFVGGYYYDLVALHSRDVLTFMRGKLNLVYNVRNANEGGGGIG
jgi:hypothetical protein